MSETSFLRSRWFEDIPVGEFHVFGSYTFSEQEIIDFGKLYTPQIYHTDPEAALDTRYRGLVASKWHICAIWMRQMVDYMERYALGAEDGRRNGAGARIEDLEQCVPVKSGHTLTFTHEIIDKPNRVIRENWGIIRSRNEAFNHKDELVPRFNIDILADRSLSVT